MSKQKQETPTYENPVKRLFEILKAAKSGQGNLAMKYVWADALGVERDNNIQLYIALADLEKLFYAAIDDVQALDDPNQEHFLRCFEKIQTVIK